ncbi:MAG: hypothetical protein J6J33_01710 [Clostridia bacterium]|nr:hypothetical protein [Clostridia bacterium]
MVVTRNKTDEEKVIDVLYGGIKLVTSYSFENNKVVLFEFCGDKTLSDVFDVYDKIKEIFDEFKDVTLEEETFLLDGFWIKAKNLDSSKVLDSCGNVLKVYVDPMNLCSKEEIIEYLKSDNADELFKSAVKLVMHNGGASSSFLQRRLAIGYSRAAKLIDIMEVFEFVAPMNGEKYRKVLITSEMYKEYFGEDFV